ncbi:MAG: hypothetical protein GC168_00910 [Candidatus Hydrogenedens sp.]|nr:hypothetical protein [Candidatus Hydrogenedens sp.]
MRARFGRALALMTEHGWLLVAIALALGFPMAVLAWAMGESVAESAVASFLFGGLSLFTGALANAAVIVAVNTYLKGGYATLPDAYRTAFAVFPLVLPAYALSMGAIAIGTLFFILPGLYLGLRLAFVLPAVLLEGLPPFRAIERSWNLSRDNLIELFMYYLLPFATGLFTVALTYAGADNALSVFGQLFVSTVVSVLYLTIMVDFFRELARPPKASGAPGAGGEILYKPLEDLTRQTDGHGKD